MAVAALRNLVTKIRIRGPRPLSVDPLPTLPPPPKGDLENALRVKDRIQTAEAKELRSSGALIAQHCEETREILNQVSERYSQVSRAMRRATFKYGCTGAVLGFIQYTVQSYYYNAEFDGEGPGINLKWNETEPK